MSDNHRILTTYDNKQVELVFNETFLCPSRDVGIIDLELGKRVSNWKMRLVFSDEEEEGDTPFTTKWEFNIEEIQIKVTFFKWLANTWIELKSPRKVENTTDTYYFKIRSEANSGTISARNLHISIWKAI